MYIWSKCTHMIYGKRHYHDTSREVKDVDVKVDSLKEKIEDYNKSIDRYERANIRSQIGIQVFKSFQKEYLPTHTMYEYTDKYYPIDAYITSGVTNASIGVEIKNRDARYADDERFPNLRLELEKCNECSAHAWQNSHFYQYLFFNFMIVGNAIKVYIFNIIPLLKEVKPQPVSTLNKKQTCDVNTPSIQKWVYELDKKWATQFTYQNGTWSKNKDANYS